MSKYSEFLKGQKVKDLDFFFGKDNYTMQSNQYLTYQSVLDDKDIIIRTNNIKFIKGNPVLVVDNDKVVYLKDWQLRESGNYNEGLDFYLVKINADYFKPYQFRFSFDDVEFEKEQTFEDLKNLANEQQEANLKVRI